MKYKKKKDRKNIILITVAALALVVTTAVWLLCFTGDNQGYRTISVVDLSGNVSVVKDDIEYSAYPGMVLQEGHEIVTAANSYVRLVLDDDKYVKLEPGSKMVFDTLGVFGSNKTKLNLERGSMTSEIVKPLDSDAEYVVVAPNAVLSVRGTFFRVDLGVGEDGQINADVMTYGGSVASQRVMPTGEVVEEEVLIDAGFKTSINMDTEDTVYVMQSVDGAKDTTGDGVANLAPIVKTDIPDEDMVDIYFASENGHELFVTAEEVKEDIEVRGINLEEQTSVYDKAEVILAEQKKETANEKLSMTDVTVFADDNVPLARVEVEEIESESVASETTSEAESVSETSESTSATPNVTQGMLTDGLGEEVVEEHVHISAMGGTAGAHRVCTECGDVLSTAHSFSKKETTAATCESEGENTYTCLCGYSYIESVDALGHIIVNGGSAGAHTQCETCGTVLSTAHSYTEEIVSSASCTEDGVKKYTCSCGHSYTESILATGHSGIAASACKTVCSHCNSTLSTNHSYISSVTTAATCSTPGVKTYSCVCGSTYTEEIPATGHTEITVTTEPTCVKAGGTVVSCSTCGEIISSTEKAALGHTEVTTTTPATCTEAGSTVVTCTICGESLSSAEIPAIGHNHTSEVTTEATCEEDGVRTYTCDNCGDTYTEAIPATGHTETDGKTENCHVKCSVCQATIEDGTYHEYADEITTPATCTTAGVHTYTCACGYSYTKEISATGHTEVTTTTPATCTEAGSTVVTCSVCEETISNTEIPATGHNHTSEVTTEATCEGMGVLTYTCGACGDTYTEAIEALGHEEIKGGTEDCHLKCNVCDKVLETGHTMVDSTPTQPTCTQPGEMRHECSCGYYTTTYLDPLGHTEVTTTTEATCTETGSTVVTCSVCGETLRTTEIPATGHAKSDTSASVTTCQGCGEKLVDLTATNFPDATFLAYVGQFDTDGDGMLLGSEIDAVTEIDLSSSTTATVVDLTGIEHFTELTYLNVANTGITSLDIRDWTNLEYFYATRTKLTNFNGSTTTLDFSSNENLKAIVLNEVAGFTEINLTGNAALETFVYNKMPMASIDLSKCAALQDFQVANCANLTALDFSGLENLTNISTGSSTVLTSVNVAGCKSLTSIPTASWTALTTLNTSGSGVENLDVRTNTALTTLDVSNSSIVNLYANELTSLTSVNVSGCAALEILDLTNCHNVKSIDVSSSTELKELYARSSSGGVTSLNISQNTKLVTLMIGSKSLSSVTWAEGGYPNCTTFNTAVNSVKSVDMKLFPAVQALNINGGITSIDLSECDDLVTFYQGGGSGLSTIDFSGKTNLTTVTIDSYGTYQCTSMDFSGCTSLTTLNISSNTSGLNTTSLNLSGCISLTTLDLSKFTKLTSLDVSGCTALTTLDLSKCTALTTLDAGNSGITTLDFTACTNITDISVANCTALTEINASGCTSLTELVLASATNLTSLDVSNCTALTNLDISTLVNLEVFQACSAGITMLSNDSTCLNFSYNPKLKEIYVNDLTSFTEINLTANTELEKFFYDLMPMTTIDLSNCVSLQNFQTGGSNVTSLDFSNCPDIFRIINHSSSALTAINVSGCTKLCDLSLLSSNNVSSVDITNAGTEVEVGAYVADKYLVFTTTAGSTTETTLQEAEGWNDSIMYMSNERL